MSVWEWAGVRFIAIHHHDGAMFRSPGLYAFVRREASGERVLLYVDQAESVGQVARPGHPLWAEAVAAGLNELHLCLCDGEKVDRLGLKGRIVRHIPPELGESRSHLEASQPLTMERR